MRKYELTIILGTEEDETSTGKRQVEALLQKTEAKVKKNDDLSVRELAYPIKKRYKGHYYYYELEMDPAKALELEEQLRLSDSPLKHLLINAED